VNPKLILITYLNNGNFQSKVAKELIFNQVMEDLIKEGRNVESSTFRQFDKKVLFDDGTKVMCVPFSMARGVRFTHVYVDEELESLPNGKDLIYELIVPSMLQSNIGQYDVSDKNRAFTFNLNNGQIDLKNI